MVVEQAKLIVFRVDMALCFRDTKRRVPVALAPIWEIHTLNNRELKR